MAKKHPVKAHHRRAPVRKPPQAPMPGQHEFSPEDEQAMRQGQRQSRMVTPIDPTEPDADDMGGM